MSDQHKNDQNYSVEEILAEYGTGRYAKVVEFPRQEVEAQARPPAESAADEPAQVIEIGPEGLGDRLAARMSGLVGRMDHYADHMYDQAEPDEQTRKAERHIPGVDREEEPEQPVRVWRMRAPRAAPADTAPADLAARWRTGLAGRRVRVALSLVLSALCGALSLSVEPGLLPGALAGLTLREWQLWGGFSLLCAVTLLCVDVLGRGLWKLLTLRPRVESLAALAALFTLGDGLYLALGYGRDGLSCAPVAAFGMTFALWGDYLRRKGDWQSARSAAQVRRPYRVTLDEKTWSGRPAYTKWSGTAVGFGSQLQMEDGGQRAYGVAAPLLVLGCGLCAALSGAAAEDWGAFLWTASVTFTASAAWPGMLLYALPYRRLTRRLAETGAALAGWPGVGRCHEGGILMGDGDLFPPGTVRVANIRVFGDASTEKVVAYTATMLRALDCGLTQTFHDLLRAQGAFYREVSGLRWHEGGITGIIRNREVFVGTADFMHLMDVALPQGLNVRHAVFCAIDGELAGIFALNYAMGQSVNPCLSALMANDISPVLVTRDPNLIPAFLGQKFKLPVDRMEFPPVDRRMELSAPDQEHDETPVALLSREGLSPYCDAVVGGSRLRRATRWGVMFTLAGTVVGVAITFYLSYAGAVGSLTSSAFLVFMGLWLVPILLLSSWVNRY